ncbi:hypothetical protein A2215_01915 [Candidatus Berkelbacteria bacterium RIFOXYA2_FULL_43_10]|uniref:Uncharacterized protein n=1 Tax=Candidatus Berkelbacteria bacterium RIFOXYA2_FULL_43_10 TaxID=1797472 RepID=A0A1F5E718_9BACT|nr:MAG: hypothetical protein A2215_01915 [Candidatus Berkelbacteria bacterium RIFOXYA2_FULL_43_10]
MAQALATQKEVNDLLEKDVFDLIGLGRISDKKKEDLRAKIVDTIQARIFRRIVKMIEEKGKLGEYDKLEKEEAVEDFLKKNGIDTNQIYVEEAMIYKAQLATAGNMIDAGFDVKVAKK